MKKLISIFTLLIFFFLLPSPASAHLPGQPPFFKLNDKYSDFYPVFSTSISEVPQDIAPETYLINQEIKFEIDSIQLPVPAEIIKDTKFLWDFGDETTAEGLKNTHSYSKMGSYVVTIYTDTSAIEKNVEPQLLQSTMLHILPDKDYKLPKSVIKLNGKSSKDPIIDIFTLPFGEKFNFDASSSTAPSSEIASYTWDFGDKASSTDITTNHTYARDLRMIFPNLRIIDKNGFIADNFAQITNELYETGKPLGNTKPTPKIKKNPSQLPYTIAAGAVLILIAVAIGRLKKKKMKT